MAVSAGTIEAQLVLKDKMTAELHKAMDEVKRLQSELEKMGPTVAQSVDASAASVSKLDKIFLESINSAQAFTRLLGVTSGDAGAAFDLLAQKIGAVDATKTIDQINKARAEFGIAAIDISKMGAATEGATGALETLGVTSGGVLAVVGALGVGALAVVGIMEGLASAAAKTGDEISKLEKSTHTSAESLSLLKEETTLAGANFEKTAGLLGDMQAQLQKHPQEFEDGLSQIGIKFDDFLKLDPVQRLNEVSAGLVNASQDTDKAAVSMELFGKHIGDTLPNLKEVADASSGLAVVWTAEDAEAAHQFEINVRELGSALHSIGEIIGKEIIPWFNEVFSVGKKLVSVGAILLDVFGGATTQAISDWFKKQKLALDVLDLLLGGVGTLPDAAGPAAKAMAEFWNTLDGKGVGLDPTKNAKEISSAISEMTAALHKSQAEAKKAAAEWKKALAEIAKIELGRNLQSSIHELQGLGEAIPQKEIADFGKGLSEIQKVERGITFEHAMSALNQTGGVIKVSQSQFNALAKDTKEWSDGLRKSSGDSISLAKAVSLLGDKTSVWDETTVKMVQHQKDESAAVYEVANAFQQIGRIVGGSFGHVLDTIGQTVGAVEDLSQAMIKLTGPNGFNAANLTAVAAGWATIAVVAYQVASNIIAAERAASAQRRAAEYARELSSEFGSASKFSDQLTQSISDLQKSLYAAGVAGDQAGFDAIALNLKGIVDELGGISNLSGKQLKDVIALIGEIPGSVKGFTGLFGLIQQGGARGAQATKTLDDLMVEFGNDAENTGGLVSQVFIDTVKHADDLHIKLQGVQDLLKGFDTSAAQGLGAILGGLQGSADAAAKIAAAAEGKTGKELDDIVGTIKLTQSEADGLAAAIVADFSDMTARGVSFNDALKALGPSLATLSKAFADNGLQGNAAFAQVNEMARIASDAILGPLLSSIQGTDDALKGLHNSGLLTQDSFTALTDVAVDAFNKIVAGGGDSDSALRAIQPTLQTIWELQQDFGFAVDDATQKLLDQAVAAGEVGEKFKTPQQQMVDSLDHIADILTDIAKAFGVDVPNSAKQAAEDISKAVNSIPKDLHVKVHFDSDGPPQPPANPDVPGFAGGTKGKFVNFGSGTLVALHGKERVSLPGEDGGGMNVAVVNNITQPLGTPEEIGKATNAGISKVLRRTRFLPRG